MHSIGISAQLGFIFLLGFGATQCYSGFTSRGVCGTICRIGDGIKL